MTLAASNWGSIRPAATPWRKLGTAAAIATHIVPNWRARWKRRVFAGDMDVDNLIASTPNPRRM
jgi:hypothetical protein